MRDIISRHHIRDVALFQDVTRFAMDNLGNPLSAKRIADFLERPATLGVRRQSSATWCT
jgi:predicted AAA+ superfamily ATPase